LGDIFQKDPSRSNRPKHALKGGPEPAVVLGTFALPGRTPRLAGESGGDPIDAALEGTEVSVFKAAAPNRSRLHGLLLHACQEDGRGEGVPLTTAQKTRSSEGTGEAHFQPSDSAEERENSRSGISHT